VDGRTYAISHRAGADENAPPVHIVGCGRRLDRRIVGQERLSPHGLVQEYLNRSEQLWGVATDGYTLRILRGSERTVRPSYLEFDLKTLLEGELYSDFAALFRLLHRSRLPRTAEDAPKC